MRKGNNPYKDQQLEETHYVHQVIIPVCIPHEEGYFKDAFHIFKNCLQSLFKTVHSKTCITIVNNGSSKSIVNYLNTLFELDKIQEVIHTENIGKLNAILKGLAGSNIELVTISDADALFCNQWQQETVQVFNSFPKAGVVGIVPQFKQFESNCGNILCDNFFSSNMKFSAVEDSKELVQFYESIGWDKNYNHDYLKQHLTISKNNCTAVVGSGHFVATYKKELFDEIITYIGSRMGAHSEAYLDRAPLYKGLWRLTTSKNYAYHMGNAVEPWMEEALDELNSNGTEIGELSIKKHSPKISKLHFFIKNRLFVKLFSNRFFRKLFYQYKKLPKEMIANY